MHRHPRHRGRGQLQHLGGKFYDNGTYIGHDEPDTTFQSSAPGSGNNVTWTVTIGRDPAALPTDVSPGHDISHWFQLSPAPWFSMAMCDPNSYPQTPCTPNSDSNAPSCSEQRARPRRAAAARVHGDAALPAGQPPVRRQHELRRHALVRRADHRQPRVHHRLRDMQHELRGTSQLRLHPEERRADRAARPQNADIATFTRTARRC